MKIYLLNILFIVANINFIFAQQGKISGTVYDENGETIPGVMIFVGDNKFGKQTDIDGKFILSLPKGIYSLRVAYISYQTQKVNNIIVNENQITDISIKMAPQEDSVLAAIDIIVTVPRDNDAGMDYARKKSGNAQDGVNAANLRKTPATTASDAIKKITGATIQDNKFAIIRGMGDRYNAAYINGSPLPSSESDRKAISFEIFPANLLDNITIIKTGSPNLPGEFAGGILQINTKSIPEEKFQQLTFGTGYNTNTTFNNFKTYEGGKTDWLGFDDGNRALPTGTPTTDELRNANILQRGEYAKLFVSSWKIDSKKANPNLSTQYTLGLNDSIFGNPAGMIFAFNYSNSNSFNDIYRQEYEEQSVEVLKTDSLHDQSYSNNVMGSVLLNFGYKIGKNTSLKINNIYSINSEDKVTMRSGGRDMVQSDIQWEKGNVRMFTQNNMYSGQVGGEHQLKFIRFEWNGGYSKVFRDIPNMRRIVYRKSSVLENDSIPYAAVIDPNNSRAGGIMFFSQTKEEIYSGKYDFTIPVNFKKSKIISFDIKIGGLHQYRERSFWARNIGFDKYKVGSSVKFDSDLLYLPEEEIFSANYLGQMTDSAGPYNGGFSIKETTKSTDSYIANAKLNAYYGMLEIKAGKNIRFITGARYENYAQYLETIENGKLITIDTIVNDVLPSCNMVYTIENEKKQSSFIVRAAYYKTVSRPEFRELAKFSFYDFISDFELYGNEKLKRSLIDNYDIRFEYFPSPGQLISISGFYKNIANPTELVSRPDVLRTLYYTNVDKAINYGSEFEYRFKLGLFMKKDTGDFVRNTSFFANLTLIKSEVNVDDVRGSTSNIRPLQGQSPYVINAGFTSLIPLIKINATISYNLFGRRLYIVGNVNEPDYWENPRSVIDCQFSKDFGTHWQIRFNIKDILAQKLIFYQDINEDGKYDSLNDNSMITTQWGTVYSFNVSFKF